MHLLLLYTDWAKNVKCKQNASLFFKLRYNEAHYIDKTLFLLNCILQVGHRW